MNSHKDTQDRRFGASASKHVLELSCERATGGGGAAALEGQRPRGGVPACRAERLRLRYACIQRSTVIIAARVGRCAAKCAAWRSATQQRAGGRNGRRSGARVSPPESTCRRAQRPDAECTPSASLQAAPQHRRCWHAAQARSAGAQCRRAAQARACVGGFKLPHRQIMRWSGIYVT